MNEVTDPKILAQLNAPPSNPERDAVQATAADKPGVDYTDTSRSMEDSPEWDNELDLQINHKFHQPGELDALNQEVADRKAAGLGRYKKEDPNAPKEVTDPAILAQLNASEEPKSQEVTDPKILAQLNAPVDKGDFSDKIVAKMKEEGSKIGDEVAKEGIPGVVGTIVGGVGSVVKPLLGALSTVGVGLQNFANPGQSLFSGQGTPVEASKALGDRLNRGIDNTLGVTPASQAAEALMAAPFQPIQDAVQKLPQHLQEPVNQLLNVAMFAIPGAKGKGVVKDRGLIEDIPNPPDTISIPAGKPKITPKTKAPEEAPVTTDAILEQASKEVEKQQTEATPDTQDAANLSEEGLQKLNEEVANTTATELENSTRDYPAEATVPSIPAGKPKVSFKNKQKGAIDLSDLAAVVDKFKGWFSKDSFSGINPDHLVEIPTAIYRRYGPDVEMGENRQGRMDALADSKGKMPLPMLEVEKIGDQWTIVNHDGRHRSDTLLKDGLTKMPVRLTGDVDAFLAENPKQVRSQDMETMLPNPAFKERRSAERNTLDPTGIYGEAPHFDRRTPTMIEADRAVRNSNPNFGKFKQGGAISPDLIPDFGKWFRKSVLKDESGKPQILYHGTSKDKDFKNLKENSRGIYLTDDPKAASQYAVENDSMTSKYEPGKGFQKVNTASRVMPVYARLENPYHLTEAEIKDFKYASNYKKFQRDMVLKAKAQGHDGIIYPDSTVVFDGSQVKSALSLSPNAGKFGQGGGINLSAFLRKNPDKAPLVGELMGKDKRSGIEFIKDALGKYKDEGDIPSQLGLHTGSFRATLDLINNPNSLSHRILNYFDNKMNQAFEETHRMNSATATLFDAGYKFYGDKWHKLFKLNQFKKDIGVIVKMEGGEGWFDGTNYVPTVKNLIDAGLTPEAAQVWNGIHRALDASWSTMAKTAKMNGTKVPPRIPGYVPHQFKGPYAARVFKTHSDGRKEYVATLNAHTLKEAELYMKKMEPNAKLNGLEIELQKPTAEGSNVSDIFNGLWAAQDILTARHGQLSKVITSLYESAAEGIVTSVLDRNHPSQVGFALQRVGDPNFGLTLRQTKDAFRGIEQTSKAINDWYSQVKFVNEVLFPLDAAGLLKQPNLRRAVQNYTNQFLEIPNHIVKQVDEFVRDKMIRQGWDPHLVNTVFQQMNSTFAKLYLVAKPAFYAANRLQSFLTPGVLLTLKAQNGGKGSVSLALARAMPDIAQAQFGRGKLIEEASASGHISPSFMENLGPARFNDFIAAYIERTTRAESFIVSYHYFKQFMSHEEALSSAGRTADKVSVPYDTQKGTPNLLSRLPAALKPLALFATYNQHMIGLLSEQVRTIHQANKVGDYNAKVNAIKAIVVLQGTSFALFGLGGVAMMQTYDAAVQWLDKTYGFNFYTSKELGRKIGQVTGKPTLGSVAEFGIPSVATGFDFSTSGQGASIQTPLAFTNMMKDLGAIAIVATSAIKHGGVTADEAWEVLKNLPGQNSGSIEHVLKGETYSDLRKQLAGELESYTPDRQGLHSKGQLRTPLEVASNIAGTNTTRQADMTISERQDRRIKQATLSNVKHLVNVVQESNNPEEKKKAIGTLVEEYYKAPDTVVSALQQYQVEANLSSEQRRELAAIGSTEAAQWFKKWLEIKGQEPIAQGIR